MYVSIHSNPAFSKIKHSRHHHDSLQKRALKQNNFRANIESNQKQQQSCWLNISQQKNQKQTDKLMNQIKSNTQSTKKLGLKQISINVSSAKHAPIKTLSKLINFDSQSLNKSYSVSAAGERDAKCVNIVKKWNQALKKQVKDTKQKITQISKKKEKLLQKYTKLKNTECYKLQMRLNKLSINSSRASQIQSDVIYQSFLQNSANNIPKHQESISKLMQIRHKINGIDTFSVQKIVKGPAFNSRLLS